MIKYMSRARHPSESLFPQAVTRGPENPRPKVDAKIKLCNMLTAQPNTRHIPGNQGPGTKGSLTGFRRFLETKRERGKHLFM